MKESVAIIGGGPSALTLAARLDSARYAVTVYERNAAPGRKFLVAGKGGFNLTHSEAMPAFAQRYTPAAWLRPALTYFDNAALRRWLAELGVATFVGSSKKVYPITGTKPIAVLRALLDRLAARGVNLRTRHLWTGWTEDGALRFADQPSVRADHAVFALGGGSWRVTGSDGDWLPRFAERGIATRPFQPANCAYAVAWPPAFIDRHEGLPLKNIALRCGEYAQTGEVVITRFGLEGNAIYALSPAIQPRLVDAGTATVYVDLKPVFSEKDMLARLRLSRTRQVTAKLRRELKLNELKVALLRTLLTKEEYLAPEVLTRRIKALPIVLTASAPLDEAISTTGGIALEAVDAHFELRKRPRTYCIGEMLDWNAPTGGYLLQACFSMGAYLADHLNN